MIYKSHLWAGLAPFCRLAPVFKTLRSAGIAGLFFSLLLAAPVQAQDSAETGISATAAENRQRLIETFAASDNPSHDRVVEKLRSGKGDWRQLQGTLESYYEDYESPAKARLRQYLITPAGERIELVLPAPATDKAFGVAVTAAGFLFKSDDQELSYLAMATDPEGVVTGGDSATAQTTQTTGDQNTLIILVNFYDDTSQPFTPQEAADVVFGTSSDFLYENSFGLTSVTGVAYGWYTVNTSVSICDSENLMTLADQAVANDGIDPAAYDRVVYLHPRRNACGWSGLASLGGSPSRILLNGTLNEHNATHEIGHTLGLYHAHALECGALAWDSNCQNQEYGDSLDNMGARMAHYNGFHKEQLGWLPSGSSITADVSGTYDLEPYAASPSGLAKVLKIPRGTDPLTGTETSLYVEFRQPIGFDDIIVNDSGYDTDNLANGVVVRSGSESNTNSSNLLDMTPDSAGIWDFFDPALEAGQTFTDPLSGVTITTLSADANLARVYVEMAPATDNCTAAQPQVSLTAQGDDAANAGDTLHYDLTVSNRDTAECHSAVFKLTKILPSDWSGTLSSTEITLSPGASGTVNLAVTSPVDALAGTYVIETRAVHGDTGDTAGDSVGYTVLAPEPEPVNTAPVAVDDSATTAERTDVVIPVLSNDSDPEGDPLAVSNIDQPAKGSVSINSDGSLTFSPHKKFSGTEIFTYTITDGEFQDVASVTVSVGGGTTDSDPSGDGNGNNGSGKGGGKKT